MVITDFPSISQTDLLFVSGEQMKEVERRMQSAYKIHVLQMMENAGRGMATLARKILADQERDEGRILVFAGKGGNAGGVLCAARRLHLWGFLVHVYSPEPESSFKSNAQKQLVILKRLGIQVNFGVTSPKVEKADLLIDGLLGYAIKGKIEERYANLIRWMNEFPTHILALDLPSGIDPDEGLLYHPFIKAFSTLTLAMPKRAFLKGEVRNFTGGIYLADISVPWKLYNEMGLALPKPGIFKGSDILKVRFEG